MHTRNNYTMSKIYFSLQLDIEEKGKNILGVRP